MYDLSFSVHHLDYSEPGLSDATRNDKYYILTLRPGYFYDSEPRNMTTNKRRRSIRRMNRELEL